MAGARRRAYHEAQPIRFGQPTMDTFQSIRPGLALAGVLLASGAVADEPLQAMDTNGDGVITAAEHESGARETFLRLDANHDGQITVDEVDAAHAQLGASGPSSQDMSTADRIRTIDVNADGAISAGEYEAAARSRFTQMDLNRDGKLAPEERAAFKGLVTPANPG